MRGDARSAGRMRAPREPSPMPIRFRCPHCNQLLGISRRKAGTPVECPTCHRQVTVPLTDQEGAGEPAGLPDALPGGPAAPPLFERSDFEAYLEGAVGGNAPRRPPPPSAPPPSPALAPVPAAPRAGHPYPAERFA